jgi:hypothetical protein
VKPRRDRIEMNSFVVDKSRQPGTCRLSDIFTGLADSPAIVELLEDEATRRRVLNETVVEVIDSDDYMYVSQRDGRLVVGNRYLKEASEQFLYLDVVHELVHVKQFLNGADLYDSKYNYVDRPTEIEAYKLTVKEARRLGMSDCEIADYLLVEWITRRDRDRLARRLGVKVVSRGRRKPPVP